MISDFRNVAVDLDDDRTLSPDTLRRLEEEAELEIRQVQEEEGIGPAAHNTPAGNRRHPYNHHSRLPVPVATCRVASAPVVNNRMVPDIGSCIRAFTK